MDVVEYTVMIVEFTPPEMSWRVLLSIITVGRFAKVPFETAAARLTVPAKPLILVKSTWVGLEDPTGKKSEDGREPMPKLPEDEENGVPFETAPPARPTVDGMVP